MRTVAGSISLARDAYCIFVLRFQNKHRLHYLREYRIGFKGVILA
jgi:hypothetical protein